MFEQALHKMRDCVRRGDVKVRFHASLEMLEDNLDRIDIEYAILHGIIVERQRDRVTREHKYRIVGTTYEGLPLEVVAKIEWSKTVIITAYLL